MHHVKKCVRIQPYSKKGAGKCGDNLLLKHGKKVFVMLPKVGCVSEIPSFFACLKIGKEIQDHLATDDSFFVP